jgi:hypothetical protein
LLAACGHTAIGPRVASVVGSAATIASDVIADCGAQLADPTGMHSASWSAETLGFGDDVLATKSAATSCSRFLHFKFLSSVAILTDLLVR